MPNLYSLNIKCVLLVKGAPFYLQRGGGGWSIFEINNFERLWAVCEINDLLQELCYTNM